MKVESVKLVYFSPTGTTRAVVQGIASGLRPSALERIDITTPKVREQPLVTSEHELLVIGVPVYMGRVPTLLSEWLTAMQALRTPTVCVVVYGNRAYENALLELKDIVTSRGGIPIAGAAFVGEHSFADSSAPIALGRPDAHDSSQAAAFGQHIREKLEPMSDLSQLPELRVPGTLPYGGITELWSVDFIAVDNSCVQCGVCAEGCPVGAIDPDHSATIDQEECITCCACIKACPVGARTMKPGPVKDARNRLLTLHSEPKKPETFL